MRILLFALLLALAVPAIAQQPSLVGTWKFRYLVDSSGREREDLRSAGKMFADLVFVFAENGRYRASLTGRPEDGSWTYAPPILTIRIDGSGTSELRVLALTDSSLLLRMDSKGGYALKRVPGDSSLVPTAAYKQPPSVVATKAEVAKRWYLKRREVPDRTEEQIRMLSELVAGSYLEFRPDGGYKGKIGQLEVDGTWTFGEGNRSIVVSTGKDQQFWTISRVTASELVLVRGSRQEVWKFTATP
ncbi:hypothetical protein [Flaviaesturariibacter terrae]